MKHLTVDLAVAIAAAAFCAYYAWTFVSPAAMYAFLSALFIMQLASYAVLKHLRFHAVDTVLAFAVSMILWTAWKLAVNAEGFDNQQSKKGQKRKQPKKESMHNDADADSDGEADDEDDDESRPQKDKTQEDFEDAHVDLGTTFLKAYNKLSPDMVKDMHSDTKELMNTQKQLMETLSNMGPAVQQGVDLIESFKKYFGAGAAPGGLPAGLLGGVE